MRSLAIFFLSTCLIACTEISYKEPQPKGVKSLSAIPNKFHGKFIVDDKDTVYINEKGLRGKDKGKDEFLYLSDSLVLKEYKGNYFVSYRDGELWLLRILTQKKNGDVFLLEMESVPDEEDAKKEFLKKLSAETLVAQMGSNYVIEPSPKKLNKLVKKGLFKEQEKAWLKKLP